MAIKITNSQNIEITDCSFSGFDTAIQADNVVGLLLKRNLILSKGDIESLNLSSDEVLKIKHIIQNSKNPEQAIESITRIQKIKEWSKVNAVGLTQLAVAIYQTFPR